MGLAACEASLHLVCLQLEAMGAVEQVNVIGGQGQGQHPAGAPVRHHLPKGLVQRLLDEPSRGSDLAFSGWAVRC